MDNSEHIPIIIKQSGGIEVAHAHIAKLDGGTFNEVYLIEPPNHEKLIVRIAPEQDETTHWDDVVLMRREYAIQPYFATVAALMPPILTVDFTHRLLGRDYMIQTYIEGERWEDIEGKLNEETNLKLWQQFGEITRQIHDTVGEQFGWPYPGEVYPDWQAAVTTRFEKIIASLEEHALDTASMSNVLAYLQSEDHILKAVTQPCLLHGDLWLFNLLVDRDAPAIVGLLDADRAWWGDPLADWPIFGLSIRDGKASWTNRRQAFATGYGPFGADSDEAQRLAIYKIMHLGSIADWAARNGYKAEVERACKKQDELTRTLLM